VGRVHSARSRDVEATLGAEADVDESDVGLQPFHPAARVGGGRHGADNDEALTLEQGARGRQEMAVVVDEKAAQGHTASVTGAASARIPATWTPPGSRRADRSGKDEGTDIEI
jgi:hypothetical protein